MGLYASRSTLLIGLTRKRCTPSKLFQSCGVSSVQLEFRQLVCLQLSDLQCVYCPSGLHSQGRLSALFRRANGTFDCRRIARIRTPGVVLNHLIVLARPKAAALWLNLYAPTAFPDQHSGGDDTVAAHSLCRGTNPSADHA